MKNIRSFTAGDITIDKDTTLIGLLFGNVTINSDISLIVKGIVTGNITIKHGARLLINGGLINGNVFNSGNCTINGIVNGFLFTGSGNSRFSPNGYINTPYV